MSLAEYRKHIQNQILSDYKTQAKKERLIKTGNYKNKKLVGGGSLSGKVLSNNDIYPSYGGAVGVPSKFPSNSNDYYYDTDSDSDLDSDSDSDSDNKLSGGKINFIKSLKKVGNTIGNDLKQTGQTVGKAVVKEVSKKGMQQLSQGIQKYGSQALKQAGQYASQFGAEAIPMAEEEAPMLLAAGVKKPRKMSEKQLKRHALIRKLMKKHGMTMIEANKAIKEHNLL